MSLPTDKKREIVLLALSKKSSISSIAKDYGISRKVVYSWIKRYQTKKLKPLYKKGRFHPREYCHSFENKVIRIVKKNPYLSISKISKQLKVGRHAVYNLLSALELTTEDSRIAFCNLYCFPGILSPEIKVSVVRSIVSGGKSITESSKENRIARKTIYKWIEEYKNKGTISNSYVAGFAHPKSLGPEIEKSILVQVVINPNLSIHSLSKLVNYSVHGVYNVLKRHNLTYKDARISYAASHVDDLGTVSIPSGLWQGIKNSFTNFITPNLAPAPPPSLWKSVFKAFTLSLSLTISASLILVWWVSAVISAPNLLAGIGMIFAIAALGFGMFFFFYSIKYYISLAMVLSHSQNEGLNDKVNRESAVTGLKANLGDVKLKKHPFVSIHVALYNEKHVVERLTKAVTSFDYSDYEVILADDSTDETSEKIREFQKSLLFKNESLKITNGDGWTLSEVAVRPGVTLKHLHRNTRTGYKGAALALALTLTDKRAEYISIFDADFVPYSDSISLFLKYFQIKNDPKTAAVQGYQWHVLNKSENWITRGVRSEYSGSYVIERAGTEIYSGLKQISGSVYMIKKSILEEIGWGTSITEDFELTLKLYQKGYKVVYTPYIQAPAECVSTLRRLVRQRMRWAEGHSFNIKKMILTLLKSPKLSFAEKFETVYLAPYYLQAMFFLVGTMSWLVSETVFRVRLPLWTEIWGWSLVLTNMISLPLLNSVGLFLEESERKDYSGIPSFIALSYIVVPFQAYAAVKGFLEKEEGPWFRTPKTGRVTDIFTRNKFYRFIQGIVPGAESHNPAAFESPYLSLATANNRFDKFDVTSRRGRRWIGKLGLTFTVLISVILTSMAPFIPSIASVNTVSASDNFSVLQEENSKSFDNGVLAVNSNKLDYIKGETAYIQMASLDSTGHTLCDSDLNLEIRYPSGKIDSFMTDGGGITNSPTCGDDNVTDHPDYFVMFNTSDIGAYLLTLTNLENGNQITNTFTVENHLNISTERISATRINPSKSDYEMKVKFKAYKDINQIVTDKLPSGFVITELGDGKVELGQDSVSMHVNLKSGQEQEFFYKYQAPEISPEFYIINGWQIASDATRLYVSNAAEDKTLPSVQGTWSNSTNSLTRTLGDKSGAATTQAFTGTATNSNNMIGRWQSLPLSSDTSFTTSNTVQYIIGAKTSSTTSTTMHFRVHIFVIESDGSTVRGTLLSNSTGAGTAFSTTATGRTDSTKTLSNNVDAKAGDRIVVEIGCNRTGTSTSSRTCTFNYGNTGGTDLTSGSTSVTTNPGWVEFSNDFSTASGAAPTVTTQAVTDITSTTATGNGTVTLDNGFPITERGIVWNTAGTPTTSDSKATASGTTGAFTASITGLSSGVTYHTRAYATNSQGTSYGSEEDFTATAVNNTQYSFQRKTWYDGSRFWKSYMAGNQIQFWYSTDGSSWTQNTSATITTSAGDFSIEADSTNAFIVYSTSNDIRGQKASSYPGTGFSWGGESVVFNGTGVTDDYSYAVVTRDSSSYIWVGARFTGSGVYYYKTIKSAATNTIPVDSSDSVYTVSDTGNADSNVFGNIVPRTSQNMYTIVTVGTALRGCVWNNASTAWQNSAGAACGGGGGWYNSSWSYRVKITIDSTKVDADLTDYPVYVDLSNLPAGFHSHVNQTDARDIRVTKSDGTTELPREVVFYTAASDTGELHFKYSGTLSGSTNTDVYIYYGNAAASDYAIDATYGAQNVWNSGYQGVWHLNETSDGTGAVTRYDSTSNNNDLTDVNTTASGGGKMGNGTDHVRANEEYLTITDAAQSNLDATSALSLSYWFKGDLQGSQAIVAKGTWNDAFMYDSGCGWGACGAEYYMSDGWTGYGVDGTTVYPWGGTWANVVWVHDGGTDEDRLYYGGALDGTQTGATNDLQNNAGDFYIGNGQNPYYADGIIDEVRMANVVRSGTWISTEYNNQNSPSTFYSVGAETAQGSSDTIATVTSGTSSNISAVADSSGNVHLVYVDSSGNTIYKEYTSSWQAAVTLDSNSGNSYVSISLDTSNSSLYAFWVRSGHIYYKNGASPYASGNWDGSATDWKSGTNLTNLTSNYSGNAKTFVEWTSDAAEPYTVNWDQIVVPEFAWMFIPLVPFVPLLAKYKKKKYAEKRTV